MGERDVTEDTLHRVARTTLDLPLGAAMN